MKDLAGRRFVVTGATSGIGRAAAEAFARRGAELTLVCRDPAKFETVRSEIATATGNVRIDLVPCDFASFAQIRRAAAALCADPRPIHVLLNNAGVIELRRRETEDGLEATFAVNHLGYFLLTNLLLDRIRASAPARIVNVASDAHRFARRGLDFDDLQSTRSYGVMTAYGKSKLANILFTRELARRLEGTGVTVYAIHPGAVGTGFATNNGWFVKLLMRVGRPLLRTPEQGAASAVYCATAAELAGVSGRYYADERESKPAETARDEAAARQLWEVSERLTGLAPA